jgi:uncharacterized repeat protein (TIGR03803 family)
MASDDVDDLYPSGDGRLFSVNTDGTDFTVLHQFSGTDGIEPDALVADRTGMLYGITHTGGSDGDGVLFSLSPDGVFSVMHNFTLPISGYPNALIIAPNGILVGSSFIGGSPSSGCSQGCGTIFTYEPAPRRFATQFTFTSSGASEGYSPYVGSLGPGPTIYAADPLAILSLNRQSGLTDLADLNFYTVGVGANSGPVYTKAGTLFGVLYDGVTSDGMIYSLQNGVIQDLHVFGGGREGGGPVAKPFVTPSGALIGTTTASTCADCGTVWEFTP